MKLRDHIDPTSFAVIAITLVLFAAALFTKGFRQDLLLEAGVFLVSVKLILMAYKNSRDATEVKDRLANIERAIAQHESPRKETKD